MASQIAVIGATGMLGTPVARELSNAGFKVCALVRDIPAAKKKLPENITLVPGDLKNVDSIKTFLKGHDTVYLNLSVVQDEKRSDFHTESDGLKNIIEAAKATGVTHIAMISSLVKNYQGTDGYDWWVLDIKQKAIDLIQASGLRYTLFYPSTFMDCFQSVYRQGNRILLAGKSEYRMWFIAADDFALQVVNALKRDTDLNREYVVQGPEAFTADEAAALYVRTYQYEKLSIAKLPMSIFSILSKLTTRMSYGYHIIQALNKYPEKFAAEKTWAELGKPRITLQEYATRKRVRN